MPRLVCLFVTILLLSMITCQCTFAVEGQARPRIVVMPFDDQSNYVHGLSEALCTQFSTELRNSGRFDIYERRLLDKILQEHNIALSGLVDPATAVSIGKMTGCQLVAMGTIMDVKCETGEKSLKERLQNLFDDSDYITKASVTINYEVVDVESGEIWQQSTEKGSENKSGAQNEQASLIKQASFKTASVFVTQRMHPMVKGKVIRVDADRFIVNLGSSQGISSDTEFSITTQGKPVIDSDTGEVIGYEQVNAVMAHPTKDGIQPGMCYAVTGFWKKSGKNSLVWQEDPARLRDIAAGAIVVTTPPQCMQSK